VAIQVDSNQWVDWTDRPPAVARRGLRVAPETFALVFAQDRAQWRLTFNRYLAYARPRPDGTFTAIVPPGDYYAAAVKVGRSGRRPKSWQLLLIDTVFGRTDTVSIVIR
jgi:hypothetical protein